MNTRSRHLLILLVPLAALGLPGCGSDSGGGASTPAGDSTSPVVSSATAATPTPPTFEGGSATVSVSASDDTGVAAVTLVDPLTSTVVPLTLAGGVWTRTVELPGNGSTTGSGLAVSLAVTARDAAGNATTAPIGLTIPAAVPPPALP